MIRTQISMRIRLGAEAEFEQAWFRGATSVAEVTGNIAQELVRDAEDAARYVVTSDWESEEALSAFSASPQRVEFSAVLETYRESAERHVYELVRRLETKR